jgi:hypothetical protein
MITTMSRILATVVVVALGLCVVVNTAPVGIWQMLLVCVGWALAYFGDELAPLVGITSTPATSPYVEPVVRGIGWLLLLAASGVYIGHILRIG